MVLIKYAGSTYQYTSDLQLLTAIVPRGTVGSVIDYFNRLISLYTRQVVAYDRAMDVVEHMKLLGLIEEI